jgi:hypothetical protein
MIPGIQALAVRNMDYAPHQEEQRYVISLLSVGIILQGAPSCLSILQEINIKKHGKVYTLKRRL